MSQSLTEVTPTGRVRPVVANFSTRRNARRQSSRERIHARVVHPIDTPRLLPDPLERRESATSSALSGLRLLVAAIIIHALIIVAFAVVGSLVGKHQQFRPPERLTVQIVETPKAEPPPVEPPKVVEAPIVPEFEPTTPPKQPDVVPPKAPKANQPAQPLPAAPTEAQPVPRRVVGLNLESTVQGNGAAFATGTSRMGQTDARAIDPAKAKQTPTVPPPMVGVKNEQSGDTQRVASHIPTRDTEFEKPKRLRPSRPEYPATLKAQGIEGDVVVKVDIAADGHVTAVTIVRGSGLPAFDEAAKRAAAAEQFAPATREGKPVAFTLSYSYRFRIED